MTFKKITAFTLAEILITLAIIGVVAAITVPSLQNNIKKQDTVTKVKKAYSILSNATESIKADCGGSVSNCLTNPDALNDDDTARKEITDLYKSKLKINKECLTSADTGCFANETYLFLNNTDFSNYSTVNSLKNARFSLADGMAVAFDYDGGTFGSSTTLYHIIVDINGIQQPNQVGKDSFFFYYDFKVNVLKPLGDGLNCKINDSGNSCAVKILQEGEINYY